ncbi:aminoglycoside 3'-phosphotransferase [Kineosporia rhizophila]|uniref:APH(3') family aminoglycoside O-phosphotransferase n=1 Tax=Kineosporia TaxID=49184 RepID=UPI001E5337C0|nr:MULTISPECIES: APH(3') family aminoglycoside O-phosphotransferase [Kineosporia]MCE0536577.1 aminoglycoside 3'-phosphotransferase [Kineosporia rhizophila]GLY13257.1 aminoglycoside phosphotransferase APH(3') [Kineosporia sp. NBRC 101677]
MSTPLPPATIADEIHGYEWVRDTVGQSGNAVHRLRGPGRDLFLKHGRGEAAEEVTDEMVRLAWLRGRIPAPEVVRFVRSPEDAWLLTTALPGRSALLEIEADAERVVDALADFTRRLHALDADTCPFVAGHAFRLRHARANIDAGRVDADDFDEERQGWTPEQVWQELTALLPLEAGRVVTHGDLSLDNVLLSNGEVTGLLDVGRLGLADRYQDLGILSNALGGFGADLRARFLQRYGETEPDLRRLSFHVLLDELF